MDYSLHMLARAEHELLARSLRPVPEHGYQVAERRSRKWRRPKWWIRPVFTTLLRLTTK